ncbi:MAG: ATP synthase F1 subunit delta [Bacteroidales bacterium]|nr:ATP synthase F1 subunit delta [Bacteroidales bacterium]
MNDSKISVRYAKALFNLAVEKEILEPIKSDVELLLEICKIEAFKEFLHSPIIPISKKQQVFKGVFTGSVNQYVVDFLLLLAKSRREVFLEIITLDFLKFYRDLLGITEVELTTASQISEKSKEQFIEMLTVLLKSKIDIKHKINESIIGGFVLRIDDKQIDASVKTQLQDFKKELVK